MILEYCMEGLVSALLSAFVCNYREYVFLVISTILGIVTTLTMKTGFYNPVFTTLEWMIGVLTWKEALLFALSQWTGMLVVYVAYRNKILG